MLFLQFAFVCLRGKSASDFSSSHWQSCAGPAKDFVCSAQIRPSLAQETRKLQLQSQPGSPCHPVKNTHAHGYTICK